MEALRRAWPDVLQTLTKIKRSTWALVEPNAQVAQFDGQVLTLAFTTGGLAGAFGRADHSENLRQAIHKTIGIDCQIVAVAGGNSSASSEPNPKAPTSRETPAASAPAGAPATASAAPPVATAAAGTSAPAETAPTPAPVSAVDSAWGLAPASAAVASPAPAPAASAPAEAPEPSVSTPARAEPAVTVAAPTPVAPAPAAVVPAPAPAASTQEPPVPVPAASTPAALPTPEPSGDYSYPDDDWGPPLDEDAPPLDEEPPADWEPPADYRHTSSQPTTAVGSQSFPTRQSSEASVAPVKQASVASSTSTSATTSAAPANSATAKVADDPWSRAVEQAPGTWVVGTESNVGKQPAQDLEESAPATDTPDYEPAAAQVPAQAAASGTYGHPTNAEENPSSSWDVAPASSWPGTQQAAAPAVWPSLASQPEETHGSVATLEEAAPSGNPNGRQSLYQRLTNSPEAQAGRVQAPVRTQAKPESVAEDIPSPEDETIEESRVFGRAAVERILGGKLIEERALDGSPLQPR